MNEKRHCDLCENQILSLKEGTICALTKNKPSFNKTCLKINFDKKIKKVLENVFVDLAIDKKKIRQSLSGLILNSVFGLILIIGGYLFFKIILNKGIGSHYGYQGIAILVGIIILTGSYLFKKPFVELASYNKEKRKNKNKIFKIQEVLDLYNITYKIDIKLLKEIYGEQEYNFDIKIIK